MRNYIIFIIYIASLLTAQESKNPLFSSFKNYIKAKDNTPFQVKWISAGPVTNSARVEALQGDPNQPGTMYVAFGSGNLWKTTNNGLDWKPIFENQPTLGIGDIAIAPSNSEILYLGTGESLRKNRNFTMSGTGVYRSDDGGETWTHLGLEETWHIGEIVVHPHNPDIVFVAAMGKFWSESTFKGIYRTINGGKDWERVLYIDKNTRANDIVIAYSNPKIVYASMWENNDNTNIVESVYGPNSGIYYSSDGGSSWNRSMDGLPEDPKIGRIGLAVSYQNAQKVYALMDNRNQTEGDSAEVYQSLNGGVTWRKTHNDTLRIFPRNNIGWYFADIYVSPKNDDEIYSLGVRMAHSKDGGKTFSTVGGNIQHLQPSPAQTLHLDHCELWINPINPNHLALGNDGGLYVTYDKGANWLHLNNIPTGEFYDITLDNQKPYNIYGGVQDNATVYGPAKEWNPHVQDAWKYLWIDAWSGGDGCVTQVDPNDHNTVYFSRQHGDGLRKDMNADTSITIGPSRKKVSKENNLRYNFVSPYFISPHDSKTLYHGANHVIKSSDRGDSWQIISGNIAESSKPEKKSWAAGAIAESELKPGLLYVGTDHGAFWVSKNSGKSWKEYSDGLPNALGIPTSTLQGNIYYHLGLTYYLQKKYHKARYAYEKCLKLAENSDSYVAAANWLYVIYRHLGQDKKAVKLLKTIKDDMDLIENHSYHTILKLYQGSIDPILLEKEINDGESLNNTTLAFGLGNYYSIIGNEAKAQILFEMITKGNQWSAFGYIAAESRL